MIGRTVRITMGGVYTGLVGIITEVWPAETAWSKRVKYRVSIPGQHGCLALEDGEFDVMD